MTGRWGLGACAVSVWAGGVGPAPAQTAATDPAPAVVVLAPAVRDSINSIWRRSNQHWNELAKVNTLTQMLGSGPPTQREYMGCLVGHSRGDTVWVDSWQIAHDLKQLQFAVTGTCDHVPRLIGTWHTHPYRASPEG